MNNKLVEDNLKLISYIINRYFYGKSKQKDEWEDMFSCGTIGLVKAAKTYDPEKGKFCTWAAMCIKNSIRMYFRQEKKNKSYVDKNGELVKIKVNSLDAIVNEETTTLGDIILLEPEYEINFAKEALNDYYKNNETKQCKILKLHLSGLMQREIANMFNIKQSDISRCLNKARREYKKIYDRYTIS